MTQVTCCSDEHSWICCGTLFCAVGSCVLSVTISRGMRAVLQQFGMGGRFCDFF